MDIWKQVAIDDLKRFNYLESSVKEMRAEIADINAALIGGGYNMGSTPVQGGSSKLEDKYNNYMVKKDRLIQQVGQNEKDYIRIKKALDMLDETDRKLLNYAYINRTPNYIRLIMDTFCIESAQAYRYINNALNQYVRVRYGV